MQVIFRGDPIELERGGGLSRTSITLEGVTFKLGVPTDASGLSPKLQGKLSTNNHFEVVAEDDASVVAPAAALAADPTEASADADEAAATAAHVARASNRKK
jgi:hypothetical protein